MRPLLLFAESISRARLSEDGFFIFADFKVDNGSF